MKRIAFTFFVFILGITSQAQVQLIHTFENVRGFTDSPISFEKVFEPMDCYVIIRDSSIYIYNADFTLSQTVNLSVSDFTWESDFNPTSFAIYVSVMGRHLINTDDKIEFLINADGFEERYNEYGELYQYFEESTSTIIISEDKDLICDFGTYLFIEDGAIHKVGDQLRLWSYTPFGMNIYSLGGSYNPTTMTTYTRPNISPNPYPNPSRNTVTLPYTLQPGEHTQLRIFNMNGQLLETFNIGSDFDKILLNVSNYSKGTYIYTYNGVSKKFVVQ